jgi:TatD DNase family protein
MYRENYRGGKYANVYDFAQAMYENRNIEALVDIWCEAPVQKMWKEFAGAALDEKEKKWGNIKYWFALGAL